MLGRASLKGRVWVVALCALSACAGCNGSSAPPASSGSTASPTQDHADRDPSDEPQGEPQSGLARGRVVLEAPPRAPVELSVEVADTPQSRQMGLMFREELGDDEGMFFVFPDERPQSFWMRNTLIPLDMFFIDSRFEVIGVVENAEPQTDTPRRVEGASQYVLEVNGGFAAEHGFGAGTTVRYVPPGEAAQEAQ